MSTRGEVPEVGPRALVLLLLMVAAAAAAWIVTSRPTADPARAQAKQSDPSGPASPRTLYRPTPAQWATLTVEPVEQRMFRSEITTEGKIAVDEDRATPIFSPYAGRIARLFVKPGDTVAAGQPLFTVEAADMVQAQNDLIGAVTTLNKARAQLNLAQIVDKRQRFLFEGKAVPLKEVQQARNTLDTAESDARSAEAALDAARNRLRLLGKTDQEIADFQEAGTINPATPIYAPIAGTIVQRKVGPGQYVSVGASDPVFVIGDLSKVWLIAYMRETEAPRVRVGQPITFSVLAYPDRVHSAAISYVAAALDPTTRRLLVRATVDNAAGLLKPEMLTKVSISADNGQAGLAIPRAAIVTDGGTARVWVARDDKAIELRRIKLGLSNDGAVQVLDGLQPGDRVITQGSLFIGRPGTGT